MKPKLTKTNFQMTHTSRALALFALALLAGAASSIGCGSSSGSGGGSGSDGGSGSGG